MTARPQMADRPLNLYEEITRDFDSKHRRRQHARNRGMRRMANREAHFAGKPLRCFWCRAEMRYRDSTADHIIPRRLGGGGFITPTRPNVVASCERCNALRAAELCMLFGEYTSTRGILRLYGVA